MAFAVEAADLSQSKAMFVGQFDQSVPLGAGAGGAGRVLKIRNDVEKFGRGLSQGRLQGLHIRAVRLQGNADQFSLMLVQGGQGAVVAGRLGENHITGLQ